MDATGSSVSDMVLGDANNKGGLLSAIDKYIDLKKNNIEKLNAKILSIDPKAYKNFYDNLDPFRSPSLALDADKTPTLPITPVPTTASENNSSFRFSNIIIEAQQSPSEYMINFLNDPIGLNTGQSQPAQLTPQQIDSKANETLANIIAKLGFTYKQLQFGIPYAHMQNDPQALSSVSEKIDQIADQNLRNAVVAKFQKKLEEFKPLAKQVKSAEAQQLIESVGLKKFYEMIADTPGILSKATLTPGTQEQEPEVDMASLQALLRENQRELAQVEGIRLKLLRNPSDLGALGSFVGASQTNKFVKLAKQEPEEEVFEYYDELLPGYGDIFRNPEEHLDQTVEEVEEEEKKKDPKHNK